MSGFLSESTPSRASSCARWLLFLVNSEASEPSSVPRCQAHARRAQVQRRQVQRRHRRHDQRDHREHRRREEAPESGQRRGGACRKQYEMAHIRNLWIMASCSG